MRILASVIAVAVLFVSLTPAQRSREAQRPREQKPANTTPPEKEAEPPQTEVETIKIDTNLVTVPVIASSRGGLYISDLRKEEFSLWEDGVAQQIAFLATVNAPFHLVLLLDTSAQHRREDWTDPAGGDGLCRTTQLCRQSKGCFFR